MAKPETGGDSPNPFYDVFRSYSEPGGIRDEMVQIAAEHRDLAKLVVIGQSGQGQDIVALKVTRDARNVADGARPAMLFSAVNHAREWIAAEVGRRMPTWWLEHADDPEVAELLGRTELWFLPIQNPDGYDYTFTCGVGFRTAANEMCGATLVTDPADPLRGTYVYKTADGIVRAPNAAQPDPALRKPTQRLWRKTVRDNDGNGVFGDPADGVDPNRNYPTAWNLDDEGASNSFGSGTYRGPYPLSEPEDLAYDRLLRRITPESVINYHSAAQLLLYPFGYITDVQSDDDAWFKALTGTDGDAAVDPYISQRSSDLYITNGETTDHAYNKYGSMAWTPELDECETAAGGTFCSGGSGFTFPDDEGKVEAVFEKNLDFARNVAATTLDRDRPDRPRNATDDESQYQAKAAPDIEPNRFGVSYGATRRSRRLARRILGSGRLRRAGVAGPGGSLADAHAPCRAVARRGAVRRPARQVLPARARADPGRLRPARDGADAAAARGRRPGQRARHRRLAAAAVLLPRRRPPDRPTRRGEARAGGGRRGLHRAVAEQDAVRQRAALPRRAGRGARGERLRGRDVRRRRPPLGLDETSRRRSSSPTSACCRTSTPSSTTRATTCSRRRPGRGWTDEELPPRRRPPGTARSRSPARRHLTNAGVRNAQMLRNYMNEGGKGFYAGPQRLGAADGPAEPEQPRQRRHRAQLVLGLQAGGRTRSTGSSTRPTRRATTTGRTPRSSASWTSRTTGPSGGSASPGARAASGGPC